MLPEDLEKQLVLDFFKGRGKGYFIEVGTNDPCRGSQTWQLEQLGWTGLLIEPMQILYEKILAARPHSRVERAACAAPEQRGEGRLHLAEATGNNTIQPHVDDLGVSYKGVETVPIVTLDDLLERQAPARVDFVSIDVEGTELDVLRGFDLVRWKPELILIEDKVRNLGKHRYLQEHGYRLLRRTCLNGWYVPREHPARASLLETMCLLRKYHLALPIRQFRHWRHSRRRPA